jgi:hypothetical protein
VISDGAPTGTVTTVLGNIDARSLGRTNYHEHLLQVTPLLPGDELDDEDAQPAGSRAAAGVRVRRHDRRHPDRVGPKPRRAGPDQPSDRYSRRRHHWRSP